MDPDATLADIRAALQEFRTEYDRGNQAAAAEAGVDLADGVAGLLGWLARGGFSPDWQRAA